ncbi:DNA ligase D [Paenibacillus harenae]|uniref:DNA ligase D n=1 Tax=Paenibacillus harenae TaxID=306543 RepID=UPI0027900F52|nr:DNA ligase D [Paenibacillus harenae]MDQ0059166.1 bifunctional non-homologous end joining protein LigD [Paenibacillus harenae]
MVNDRGKAALFPKSGGPYSGLFFIAGYDQVNESFIAGLQEDSNTVQVGSFSGGLRPEEKQTLIQTIMANRIDNVDSKVVRIKPGICVELQFESVENNRLMQPAFRTFRLTARWTECTWNKLIIDNAPVSGDVTITHPDKMIWPESRIDKEAYAAYLLQISPLMMPFLRNRILTTIRYPHGVPGESFYQKNRPDYAPDFVRSETVGGINYIVCNDLSTLLWLGNQAAIEFHTPFHTIGMEKPLDIVFDLDPPSEDKLSLAIKAAIEMKTVFDGFGIVSYPKLTGGKGMQIHIPLGRDSALTYEDARVFTAFIAKYVTEKHPEDFTTERLKKNRGNRLYVDYVQHAPGKTMICPYSARGRVGATVAAPLYWEEVNGRLTAEAYTVRTVLDRLAAKACPMHDFWEQDNTRILSQLILKLKQT